MSYAKAIKSSNAVPAGFKEMAKTRCGKCGAEYLIVHQLQGADAAVAERQAIFMKDCLTGDHVDPKAKHLEAYEPLDDKFR
jgi:predicted metal-binding protein